METEDNPTMKQTNSDKALEAIVLGGLLAALVAMFFFKIPEPNKEQFGNAMGALIVIATLIANSLWKRNEPEAILRHKKESAEIVTPPPGVAKPPECDPETCPHAHANKLNGIEEPPAPDVLDNINGAIVDTDPAVEEME